MKGKKVSKNNMESRGKASALRLLDGKHEVIPVRVVGRGRNYIGAKRKDNNKLCTDSAGVPIPHGKI